MDRLAHRDSNQALSGVGSTTDYLTASRMRVGFDRAAHAADIAVKEIIDARDGAQTIQQCLDAGLLDEIHIDLAAVLLGAGVRLFDHLAHTPIILGNPTVVAGVGVMRLRYPVHPS